MLLDSTFNYPLRGENRVAAWFFCYHFQHDWLEQMGSSGCLAPACGVGPGAETIGRLAGVPRQPETVGSL